MLSTSEATLSLEDTEVGHQCGRAPRARSPCVGYGCGFDFDGPRGGDIPGCLMMRATTRSAAWRVMRLVDVLSRLNYQRAARSPTPHREFKLGDAWWVSRLVIPPASVKLVSTPRLRDGARTPKISCCSLFGPRRGRRGSRASRCEVREKWASRAHGHGLGETAAGDHAERLAGVPFEAGFTATSRSARRTYASRVGSDRCLPAAPTVVTARRKRQATGSGSGGMPGPE